jgi:hypothetical protein
LFIFCERLSKVNADAYPEAVSILKMVLEHIPGGGIGGADRTGRTIFDIEEDHRSTSGYSCLKASRQLLVEAGTMTPSRRNGKSRLRFSSS